MGIHLDRLPLGALMLTEYKLNMPGSMAHDVADHLRGSHPGLALAIESQIPVPLPTMIGAVIELLDRGGQVLVLQPQRTGWGRTNDDLRWRGTEGLWYTRGQVGGMGCFKVHSHGVDLDPMPF
jgi:hypothetical protein